MAALIFLLFKIGTGLKIREMNAIFLLWILLEIYFCAPIIFYFARAKTTKRISKFILAFSAASILCLLIMMCSPEFPERAGFPSTIFLIIASLAALKEILPNLEKKFINICGILFCGILFAKYHGLKKIVTVEREE